MMYNNFLPPRDRTKYYNIAGGVGEQGERRRKVDANDFAPSGRGRTHARQAAGHNIPVARRSLVVSGSVVYIHFGLGNPRNRCGPQSTGVRR